MVSDLHWYSPNARESFVFERMLAASGAGAPAGTVTPRYITTGNITPPSNPTWAPVSGFSIACPAAVDDVLRLDVQALLSPNSASLFDLAVLVAGAPAYYASSGAGTPGTEGLPGWYPQTSFKTVFSGWVFGVQAGHLEDGQLTVALMHKGTASGTVFASAGYPWYWCLTNSGQLEVL